MSTKFFISFAAFCVIAIGDLSYITPLYSNRQHVFLKKYKKAYFFLNKPFYHIPFYSFIIFL
ncbi:hypothetical protein FO522_29400 [Bacillus nitratireducens]|nr:hypothetical protein [Bacillus nitratireducens]